MSPLTRHEFFLTYLLVIVILSAASFLTGFFLMCWRQLKKEIIDRGR